MLPNFEPPRALREVSGVGGVVFGITVPSGSSLLQLHLHRETPATWTEQG